MPDDHHMPITGHATCTCGGHHVTIHADTDPDIPAKTRLVTLNYWRRGSDYGGRPPWGMRLRLAWAWLRGDPQSVQGILLDRGEWQALVDGLHEGARRTWGGHAVGEDD